METVKSLSIVIVTYNSQELIIDCIKSIFESSDILETQLEIIIIDNSNEDNHIILKNVLTPFSKEIKLYHNSTNGGYGQGNNIGVEKSTADIVCIVNPDVIFTKPVFKKVLHHFSRNNKLGMIGGKQYGGLNISFWIRPEYEFFLFTTPLSLFLNKFNIYFEKYFFLSGALLFVEKNKFKEIGMFDETLFLYCEEADITKRFLAKNYSTIFDKAIEYDHLIGDRGDVTSNTFNFLMKSTQYYLEKYNYSFKSYIKTRIFSHKILSIIDDIKQKTVDKNKVALERFRNLLK